jgi:pimeloyl-ACP methyl ester carboxylesterase
MYPHLQEFDFRTDVPRVEVPVYMVHGAHELTARGDLALEWFDGLQAPSKQLIVFEHSGHTPQWEEPDRFHEVMTDVVLAETAEE